MTDPIDHVTWLPVDSLHANEWNPNHVARPELVLLETSLLVTGWVHPVLVSPDGDGYMIIDGFHRWMLSKESPRMQERWGGRLPAVILDIPRVDAMLLTVRINRAKGTHGSVAMSSLVRVLLDEGVDVERIKVELGATDAEVKLLATPDVFHARKIGGWKYSPSWVPSENGLSAVEEHRQRERSRS